MIYRKRKVPRKNKRVEHQIQSGIEAALRLNGCEVYRGNVGLAYTKDGRAFRTGLPAGFPDLFGFKKKNQKMFFIEGKTPTGRIRQSQINFHMALMHDKAIHGIARSIDDALKIVNEELIGYGYPETKEKIWL